MPSLEALSDAEKDGRVAAGKSACALAPSTSYPRLLWSIGGQQQHALGVRIALGITAGSAGVRVPHIPAAPDSPRHCPPLHNVHVVA